MKNLFENFPKIVAGPPALKGARLKHWTLLVVMVGVMALQTPCEAKFWKDLLGVLCTVGGVISGSTGNVPVGVALIGCQGAILGADAVVANNTNIITGPEVTPPGLLGLGSIDHSPAAMDALLALNCPDVTVTGTPAEQEFIGKANIVIGFSRQLRTAPPATISGLLQQMSIALEDAANAYDALGLTNELAQSDWDNFKLACASGVAPSLEENYLISCGLTSAQRNALDLDQSAQRSVLDHRIKYKPGTVLHLAAKLFNTNNVGFADLLHEPVGDVTLSQPPSWGGVQLQWGSSGTGGGVNISLPNVPAWDGYWSDLDSKDTLPVGAYIESSATGDAVGALTNGLLGSWRMTKLGTSNYVVTADFSPLGTTQVTVLVFNGSNLVYSAGGQSGNLATVSGCVSDDHWGRPTSKPVLGGALTLRGPQNINVSGARVVGDRIAIVPDSAPTITAFNSVSITASGVSQLNLTNESAATVSSRPLIRWPVIGVPGFAGGCFPGFGICSFNPNQISDSTAVMLTQSNGLNLEFLTAQADATNIFTVAEAIPVDVDGAHDLGVATLNILPGKYPVDFSQNPFGTVHLNTTAADISIAPTSDGLMQINWPADGVKVLQTAASLNGPWTNLPVQVLDYRESPTLPSRYYNIKSSK